MRLFFIFFFPFLSLFASIDSFFDINLNKAVENVASQMVEKPIEKPVTPKIETPKVVEKVVEKIVPIQVEPKKIVPKEPNIEYSAYIKVNGKDFGLVNIDKNKIVLTKYEYVDIQDTKYRVTFLNEKKIIFKNSLSKKTVYFSYKK